MVNKKFLFNQDKEECPKIKAPEASNFGGFFFYRFLSVFIKISFLK